MKPVVECVRDIILAADRRMEECIKWKSPTFAYKGNLASFNPRSKKHASLMFHTGAKIPGKHPKLEGGGDTARYMTFTDIGEAKARKKDLEALVASWCEMQDNPPDKKASKKKKTSKKKAAKKAIGNSAKKK